MSVTAKETDAFRALSRLEGIMRGIMADQDINAAEREELLLWLESHQNLIDVCPFDDAYKIAWKAGKNGYIDLHEWEDLIQFCSETAQASVDTLTKDIRTLHGYLQGVVADKSINVRELESLKAWMFSHQSTIDKWPFNKVSRLIESVIDDGIISDDEQKELISFFTDFSERLVDGFVPDYGVQNSKPWTKTDAPVVETIDHICNRSALIRIQDHSFCFTGQMKAGKRSDIHKHLSLIGGIAKDGVTKDLNYLVIGANSNPCWAYSTYGRKIEKVMEGNNCGCNIIILHEDDYLSASGFPRWFEK